MNRLNIGRIVIQMVPSGAQGGEEPDVTYYFRDSDQPWSSRESPAGTATRYALDQLEECLLRRNAE